MKIQENLFGINRTQITADCADKRKLKLADKNLGVKRILISS